MVPTVNDEDFWEAVSALLSQTSETTFLGQRPPGISDADWLAMLERREQLLSRDSEACAQVMVDFAEATDDPDAWKFIAAAMDWFIENGQYPPLTFVRAINGALKRWRGGEPLAVIFGEASGKGRRGQRKSGLTKRAWKRTNAQIMRSWVELDECNDDEAAGKLAELRARMSPDGKAESITTYKRDFDTFTKK